MGISDGFVVHSESISCPSAAPNGFARLATAVALVRPLSENQRSLYRVGAHKQKGCARPIKIWPNMARPKMPPFALVPAYRSQLPTSSREAVVIMAGLGPPLFKTQMTNLYHRSVSSGLFSILISTRIEECEGKIRGSGCGTRPPRQLTVDTYGLAAQKANKYPVLIQLIALSET